MGFHSNGKHMKRKINEGTISKKRKIEVIDSKKNKIDPSELINRPNISSSSKLSKTDIGEKELINSISGNKVLYANSNNLDEANKQHMRASKNSSLKSKKDAWKKIDTNISTTNSTDCVKKNRRKRINTTKHNAAIMCKEIENKNSMAHSNENKSEICIQTDNVYLCNVLSNQLNTISKTEINRSNLDEEQYERKLLLKRFKFEELLKQELMSNCLEIDDQFLIQSWSYLEHHGLIFSAPFKGKELKLGYKDDYYDVPLKTQEIIYTFCKMNIKNVSSKIQKNFLYSILFSLPPNNVILEKKRKKLGLIDENLSDFVDKFDYNDFNFKYFFNYIQNEKDELSQIGKEEKKIMKANERISKYKYKLALLNSSFEFVSSIHADNTKVFKGRGVNPLGGIVCGRVLPDEVVINVARNAPVPKLPDNLLGHSWEFVSHDTESKWLAYYTDIIDGQKRYTFLQNDSKIKIQSDYTKFENARKLKLYIDEIHSSMDNLLNSNDLYLRQLGTAIYLIDNYAFRVGNEKDLAEVADTVGCTTLRVEHIKKFNSLNHSIQLDFYGKDNIRLNNTFVLSQIVYNNLKEFTQNKESKELLFNLIKSKDINNYLKGFMPSLTAKVYRTYKATKILVDELNKIKDQLSSKNKTKFDNVSEAQLAFEQANIEVAKICNHQKTNHDIDLKRNVLEQSLETCEKLKKQLNANMPITEEVLNGMQVHSSIIKKINKYSTIDKQCKYIIPVLDLLIHKAKLKLNSYVGHIAFYNTTSKANYIDPRVITSFCKNYDLPINKIFSKALQKRFVWAMSTEPAFTW